jgi:hypothetical protein
MCYNQLRFWESNPGGEKSSVGVHVIMYVKLIFSPLDDR